MLFDILCSFGIFLFRILHIFCMNWKSNLLLFCSQESSLKSHISPAWANQIAKKIEMRKPPGNKLVWKVNIVSQSSYRSWKVNIVGVFRSWNIKIVRFCRYWKVNIVSNLFCYEKMTRRHFFSLYYFWTTLTLETSLDILKIKILVGLILCFAWRAENQPKDIHCEQSWKKKAVSSLYLVFKRITQTPGFVFFIDFKLFYIM